MHHGQMYLKDIKSIGLANVYLTWVVRTLNLFTDIEEIFSITCLTK